MMPFPRLPFTVRPPQEARELFCAYVGGVFVEKGNEAVFQWLIRLLEPISNDGDNKVGPQLPPEVPPAKRPKAEETFQPMPPMQISMTPPPISKFVPQPPQPTSVPPPPPPPPLRPPPRLSSNPLAPAQPHLPFLPMFNQAASQRRVVLDYVSESSGPSHAPRWTVKCIGMEIRAYCVDSLFSSPLVNGILKGIGTGNSKQLAKEEAARQAFYAMGWAPRKRADRFNTDAG